MRRVGLGFCAQPYSIREIIAYSQRAEKIGFESIWITEDIWTGRDAISILSSLALSTGVIKLGTAVINIYTRHPVLTAQTFNAISELAPGRLRIGIGAGMTWKPLIENQANVLHPLKDMRQAVQIIRGLLSGQEIKWGEETISLSVNRKCFTGEVSHNNQIIPIYLGAVGPRMTELVGEIGDGLLLELVVRRDIFPTRMQLLKKGIEKRDRDLKDIDIARLILVSVSENGLVHPNALGYAAKEVILLDDVTVQMLGLDPDQINRIRKAHQAGDCETAIRLLTPDLVSLFIAAGSEEECLRFIESVVDAGVMLPILVPFGGSVNAIVEIGAEFAKRK